MVVYAHNEPQLPQATGLRRLTSLRGGVSQQYCHEPCA